MLAIFSHLAVELFVLVSINIIMQDEFLCIIVKNATTKKENNALPV